MVGRGAPPPRIYGHCNSQSRGTVLCDRMHIITFIRHGMASNCMAFSFRYRTMHDAHSLHNLYNIHRPYTARVFCVLCMCGGGAGVRG